MTEAIDYKDNGTIAITLDDKHTLRMPSADEVLSWHEQILDQQDYLVTTLDALTDAVSAVEENTPEHREASRKLNAFSRRPSYEFTLDWLEEVTKTLTDGEFPPRQDWPGWMVNQQLPSAFVKHWREVPKVSGSGSPKK
jgi:hypothetical protein